MIRKEGKEPSLYTASVVRSDMKNGKGIRREFQSPDAAGDGSSPMQ
jgi:hypothetical protein